MPPMPFLYDGVDSIAPLLERAFGPERDGDWRLLPTQVNRMPAAGTYLRRWGDTVYRPFKLDVPVRDGTIAEITTFGPGSFPLLGLPGILDGDVEGSRSGPSRATSSSPIRTGDGS